MELEQYSKDLFKAIKTLKDHATESNIFRKLYPKYKYLTTMYFNDAINKLEFEGKIIKKNSGGVIWWESI